MTVEVCDSSVRQITSAALPAKWGTFRVLDFEREAGSHARVETP